MIAVQPELNSTTYMSDHHDVFTHFFAEHINVCGWQRKLSAVLALTVEYSFY